MDVKSWHKIFHVAQIAFLLPPQKVGNDTGPLFTYEDADENIALNKGETGENKPRVRMEDVDSALSSENSSV